MVHQSFWNDPAGMVRFPVRQAATEGSDSSDGHPEDFMEQCSQEVINVTPSA